MDIEIDVDRCQGHARCNAICPEVFDLDEEGFVAATVTTVPGEHRAAVRDAVDNCPERAIAISVPSR